MTIKESLEYLKYTDQFREIVKWVQEGREQTIRDLAVSPTSEQSTLVGKLAAYQELVELFTS